ncbi:MAG: PHP domain-containing protein [Candidatus Omnitrophica bacterium]|nr:PHP domain-containing protein [Candidatus Omnitrophota bacterium]
MTKPADLHIHTHYSDGTMSPQEVVQEAARVGLGCIAITDHDTVDGIGPAIEAARSLDVEIIPGIELSTEINGKDIHMLGYLFDWQDAALKAQLSKIQDARVERMKEMIQKLKGLGIGGITLEEVTALAMSKAVGRPHLATVLVQKKIVSNAREAFDKFLAEGAPAYAPKFRQTPQEAIRLIKDLGGVAVLAHPMLTHVDELIPGLVREGLGGLEVYYPNCSQSATDFYKGLAQKYHLAPTGGSDTHGEARKHTFIGKARIPYDLVEKLKQAVNGS